MARIGLIHAIDRFDPDRGRPFVVFARATITGELKRLLAHLDEVGVRAP